MVHCSDMYTVVHEFLAALLKTATASNNHESALNTFLRASPSVCLPAAYIDMVHTDAAPENKVAESSVQIKNSPNLSLI